MGAHKIIIPLLNGRHFYFTPAKPKGERGLRLIHVAAIIDYVAEHYEGPTPRFTQADVIRIVWRLLYKREPHDIEGGGEGVKITTRPLKAKQLVFIDHYITNGFNGAKAARMAGYSPKRAKQTAYDLLHDRRQN